MDATTLHRVMLQAERLCRERRVRFTPQRRKALEIVCDADRPMGAYEILDAMRDAIPGAAPPTVYRALDFLLEQGLIHKLESLHAFVGCIHPEHPHSSQFLICSACGKISELEDTGISQSVQEAASSTGFRPIQPIIEVLGTCGTCSRHAEKTKKKRTSPNER